MAARKHKPSKWKKTGRSTIPWHKDPALLARVEAVNRMRLEGISLYDIAERLECDPRTVQRDLRRMQDLLIDERKADMRIIQDEAISRYREVQRRAMDIYNKADDHKTKLGALKEYREAQARIDALTGAAAPVKLDHTTKGESLKRELKDLSDSELALIAAGNKPDDAG